VVNCFVVFARVNAHACVSPNLRCHLVVGDDPALYKFHSMDKQETFASQTNLSSSGKWTAISTRYLGINFAPRKGRTSRTGTVQAMDQNEMAVNLTNLNAMSLSRFIAISELFLEDKASRS
jgi:Na+-transporting NADH:ubiquinone oxidoreductase subunit NqrA